MERRTFLRLTRGGLVAAAATSLGACSTTMPAEAIAAWTPPARPAAGGDMRPWILAHAILAPHSHNLQSWLVDLSQPDQITLYLDRSRLLPQTDPLSRQMLMSQGTFLELLDLAARECGLRAEITLFPAGTFGPHTVDARPTAQVRLVVDPNLQRDPLFAQITRRHTNRKPYAPQAPERAALDAIAQATAASGLRQGFVLPTQAQALAEHRRIAKEAWRIELTTPHTMLESLKVLRVGPKEIAQHRDGLSNNEPFVRLVTALGLFDRSKAPPPGDSAIARQIDRFNAVIDATPAFYWLVSEGNARTTQVAAGRAWVRAQLAATAQGLAMQPISQALQEYPEVAQPYRDIHQLLNAPTPRYTVQMWARLGYAEAVEPAPRRGVNAHILRAA